MPAVMKEVTTNSDERRRRLRRRRLHGLHQEPQVDGGVSSRHLGLLHGDLVSEAMAEGMDDGLFHPAFDELEQRYGSQGAALQLREAGLAIPTPLLTPYAKPSNSAFPMGPMSPRERGSRVAQLKRRSSALGRDLTHEEILARLGAGEPIPGDLRAKLEPLLGLELGGIRLHRGGDAGALASDIGALAFAAGSDVVLADEAPALSSKEGLFLLTHELAHVAQQARGEVSTPAGEGVILEDQSLEAQADTLAAQVAAHPTMAMTSAPGAATDLGPQGAGSLLQPASNAPGVQMFWGDLAELAGDAWDGAAEMGGDLLDGAVDLASDAVDVVADTATAVVDTVADFSNQLWDMAASLGPNIPGYDLITVLIGYDPLAGKSVPRSANNVVKGLMGLIPGGKKLFTSVTESGALQKVFTFFEGEIAKLDITVESLKGLVSQVIDSLSMGDALDPVGALERIGAIFASPWKRVQRFAANVGSKVMEFIMESVLAKAGPMGAQIMGVLKRGGNFVTMILKDPIPFLNNLVTAVKGGIEGFSARSPEHLQTGLVGWLTGAVKGGGVRLPAVWDVSGILGFAADVLGLTWDFFRPRLVKLLGEKRVSQLETTFDHVKAIVENGISAVADIVLGAVGDISTLVMDTIKNWTITKVIKSAVLKIASMLNPAGALIQAIMGIYNTVAFFMERMDQIKDLASSIMDSLDNIAGGKVTEAAAFIEQSIVRALPVVMGFMSRFIGLGNITKEMKNILAKVRAPIERGIDKACDWIAERAKPFLDKINSDGPIGGDKAEGEEEKEEEGAGKAHETAFAMNGEPHTLYVTPGAAARIEMASQKKERLSYKIGRHVASLIANPPQGEPAKSRHNARVEFARGIGRLAKTVQKQAEGGERQPHGVSNLLATIEAYAKEYKTTDLTQLVLDHGVQQLDPAMEKEASSLGISPRLFKEALRVGYSIQETFEFAKSPNVAGLELTVSLAEQKVERHIAPRVTKLALAIGCLDVVRGLVLSGCLRNPRSLRGLLQEIVSGDKGKRQELTDAAQRAMRGHQVELGGKKADVTDHTDEEAIQHKEVTSSDAGKVEEHLAKAADQLEGRHGELPPEGYLRTIDIRLRNDRNPLYDAERAEISEVVKASVDDKVAVEKVIFRGSPKRGPYVLLRSNGWR